jgi:hypothetical protein
MATRALDTVIVFRVLRLLTYTWTDQAAFKEGLIDEKGKRIKKEKVNTPARKEAYTLLHRLVFNLKRILELIPFGKTRLASYAAALFLLKEHIGLKGNKLDKEVFKHLKETGLLEDNLLEEFIPINNIQNERTYTLIRPMIIDINEDTYAERGDTIIPSGAKPAGKIYGVSVFRMYNVDKNEMMYCTGHDLR